MYKKDKINVKPPTAVYLVYEWVLLNNCCILQMCKQVYWLISTQKFYNRSIMCWMKLYKVVTQKGTFKEIFQAPNKCLL